MNKKELDGYHNIASTTKTRGMGIGFAGVGAKLSLLIAKEVITETANGNFRGATRWKLENDEKAPWKYITPASTDSKLLNPHHGTAVSIFFKSNHSELLNPEFIRKTIQKHFYTILDPTFQTALRFIYKNGINFYVNEEKINLSEMMQFEKSNAFKIHFGKKGKPVGVGFVRKYKEPLDEEKRGVAISTCGKVIKHGWDWLGISAKNPDYISGVVEMPGLSLILTTNKADFLKDTASLQKYYRYRKAVQEVIEPILKEFGEINESREKPAKELRPLEKEIRGILDNMLNDFPELDPLLGRRKKFEATIGVLDDTSASDATMRSKKKADPRLYWLIGENIIRFIERLNDLGFYLLKQNITFAADIGISESSIGKIISFRKRFSKISMLDQKISWSKYRDNKALTNL
jgi:hypothetical protein